MRQVLVDNLLMVLFVVRLAFAALFGVLLVGLLIWMERKIMAFIQDRPGPNRAAVFGIFRLGGLGHAMADPIKLIFKEDLTPERVNRFYYFVAPYIAVAVSLMTFAVIPWSGPILIYTSDGLREVAMQVAALDFGVLYILAITSLGVYALMLAGWASNNKFSLLGSVRSGAQMMSYEIAMGLALVAIVLAYATEQGNALRLEFLVAQQGERIAGILPRWGIFLQPVGFFLFFGALLAELNRMPFDLPEGEAELTAGYHTEYSSLKFAMFFMAEYVNMVVASALLATLYFGGWQIPFVTTAQLRNPAVAKFGTLLLIGAPLLLLIGAAIQLWRFHRSHRHYFGDKRDLEPIILLVVVLGLCLGLSGAFVQLVLHGLPSWWPRLFQPLAQAGCFVTKVLIFCFIFILIRWTIPRFRYDQIMGLGWKMMIPIGIINLFFAGVGTLLPNRWNYAVVVLNLVVCLFYATRRIDIGVSRRIAIGRS